MHRNIFYNYKSINEDFKSKKISRSQYTNPKIKVDINILLNRVKIEKKEEIKQKVIFFSLGVLVVSLMGIFITIIR